MSASSLTRSRPLLRARRLLAGFSDERLAEEAKRGNEAAFEVIYDRHHRRLLTFCRHMLRSRDDAEDALQHTFASAFAALPRNEQTAQLRPWLFTIARNRCLTMLRARREHPLEEIASSTSTSTAGLSEVVERRAELRELVDDLRRLPERQRAALVLSEVGALDHSQVADVLGCEPKQVKALVFQARSALIEDRRAREIPCAEIRERLATGTGGDLRRSRLRRHLRSCSGCAEFRDEVRRQRGALALALPAVPSLGLKQSTLAATGVGGGGAAGGGGILAALGASGAAKVATAGVVASGVGVLGGVVTNDSSSSSANRPAIERGAADAVVAGGQAAAVAAARHASFADGAAGGADEQADHDDPKPPHRGAASNQLGPAAGRDGSARGRGSRGGPERRGRAAGRRSGAQDNGGNGGGSRSNGQGSRRRADPASGRRRSSPARGGRRSGREPGSRGSRRSGASDRNSDPARSRSPGSAASEGRQSRGGGSPGGG